MKKLCIGLAALVLCLPRPLTPEPPVARANFIVWNVGQGLWTTLVDDDRCEHFDTGGEHAPWRELVATCGDKRNIIRFSHWDLDHISFARRLVRQMKSVCLETPPAGEGNAHKKKLLSPLIFCRVHDDTALAIEGRAHGTRTNDLSHVFIAASRSSRVMALIPGDSTRKEEKFWSARLPEEKLWLLVLGHHGSRTSTSDELLGHLPRVHMAIASSREAKYGHPHREVVERLKKAGIALLRTEDWGILRFEFPKNSPPARARGFVSRITDDRVCIRGSSCERPAHRSRGRRRRSGP